MSNTRKYTATLWMLQSNEIIEKIMASAGMTPEEIEILENDQNDHPRFQELAENFSKFITEGIEPLLLPIGETYGERIKNFEAEIGSDNFKLIFTLPDFNTRLKEWEDRTASDNGERLLNHLAQKFNISKQEAQIFVMAANGELQEMIDNP